MKRAVLFLCLVAFAALSAHARESNYEKAVRTYRENKLDSSGHYCDIAIRQYRATAQHDSLVFAYVQKVLVTWDVEGLDAAFQLVDSARRIVQKLPEKHVARVAVYSRLGQLHLQRHELVAAKTWFRWAEDAMDEATPPNRHYMLLDNYIAVLHLTNEDYRAAKRYADCAYEMNLLLEGENGVSMAIVLQTRYLISRYSEDYEQALMDGEAFRQIVQLHYGPGHPAIGAMHNSLAIIYEKLYRYEEALEHRQRAVNVQFKNDIESGSRFPLASAYQNLGNLYGYINEPFLAQEYLAKGSRLLLETYGEDGLGMVQIWVDLAINKSKIGRYGEAEQLFQKAYNLQKKIAPDDLHAMAYVESFFGNLYVDMGQYADATVFYQQALERYRQTNALHTENALLTQRDLATVMAKTGEVGVAMALQQAVLVGFRKLYPKGNDAIANKLGDISGIYLAAGHPVEALAFSDSIFMEMLLLNRLPSEARDWVSRLPFSYHISTHIHQRMEILQALHIRSRDGNSVDQLFALADAYTDFVSGNLHAFRTQAALIDLADINKAIYSIAIEACWESSGGGKDAAMMERAFAYAEMSKALLLRLAANNMLVDEQGAGTDPIAKRDYIFRSRIGTLNLQYLNSGRKDSLLMQLSSTMEQYRTFQDSLKLSDDETHRLKYALRPPTIDAVRKQLLQRGENLIEYAVTETGIFVFVLTETAFHMHRMNHDVLQDVGYLQKLHGLSPSSFVEPAYRLYQSLIKPIESYFSSNRLLIIPDADLYYLNFELLISNSKETRFSRMPYLIRRYNLSYLLSAASAIQIKKAHHGEKKRRALLFAPVFTDEMKADYKNGALRYEDDEYHYLFRQPFALQAALKIGDLVSHDIYTEQRAEERIFKEQAPRYPILHLGTHAEVNNLSPLQSRLFFAKALAGDTVNTDDGYLYAYEIYSMQLRAELAVLTACETGMGARRKGEGVISLAHSFMYAGCQSVVMSLWKIDEKSSSDIITKFYEYLSSGHDKSKALQRAKLALMDGNEQLSHPYYWAGLTLIGDGTPLYTSYTGWYWTFGLALAILLLALLFVKRRKVRR